MLFSTEIDGGDVGGGVCCEAVFRQLLSCSREQVDTNVLFTQAL